MAGVQQHRISNHIKITQNIKSGTQPLFLFNVPGKTAEDAKCCVSTRLSNLNRSNLTSPKNPLQPVENALQKRGKAQPAVVVENH